MKHKYEIGTPVLIYKCEECVSGGVGVIIDREKLENNYLVREVDKFASDEGRWVREANLQQLYFDKPKGFFDKLRRFFK